MPSQCQQIKQKYESIKSLKKELDLEYEKVKTGDQDSEETKQALTRVKKLKAILEQKRESLIEKINPYNIYLRQRLAKEKGFNYVGNFSKSEGLTRVRKDGKFFHIDKKGRKIFE